MIPGMMQRIRPTPHDQAVEDRTDDALPERSVLNALPTSGVSPRVTISEALMIPIVRICPMMQNGGHEDARRGEASRS